MKNTKVYLALLGLGMLLLIGSCTYFDQFRMDRLSTEVQLTPSLASPLAYGSFNIADALASLDSTGLIDQYEDSLLYIYFTDTAYSVEASTLIDIPDRVASEIYIEADITTSALWTTLPEGSSVSFTKMDEFDFELEPGDRIDSIFLSEGSLLLDIFSEFRHPGSLRITSSHIYNPDGDSLDVTFPISESDGSYVNDSTVDLSDYYMTFEERNDSAFAQVFFTLTLVKTANPVLPGEECGINMNFRDMVFQKLFGYVAERNVLDVNQSIEVDLFDEDIVSEVEIEFADPRLNLLVHNSYGLPLEIDLQDVIATSSYNDVSTQLTYKNDTMNPFRIKAPTVDRIGETVSTLWSFNNETTNIVDIVKTAPDRFDFSVLAGTGTAEDPGDQQNFVLDTSELVIEAEVVLPMWLKTTGYSFTDTIELEEELGLGDLSFVESANLRLYTSNQWPLQVEVQLYFLDESLQVIDSVFDSTLPLLEAAPVDGEGEVLVSSINEILNEVDYTGEEIMELESARHLMLSARAFTTDLGTRFVKFYSNYMLSYRVNFAADFLINPREMEFNTNENN